MLERLKATQLRPADWERGYGVVRHRPATRRRIRALGRRFSVSADGVPFWTLLAAADRLASAAMWLTVHDTYAKNVRLDGSPLGIGDFKNSPEGHTGSSLNIVPAFVGYLVANALTGHTRGWIAEQGHAVSGIDCVNVLAGNPTPEQRGYTLSDEGLTRFVRDFYSYKIGRNGLPESPRGSHITPSTAGGILEGGYLGFAGLQYVHLPLPGEGLVAFLSDGAFEEQRGSDWAPRWWRPEDCGRVAPILIANGRRIDQRTTTQQLGGTRWLKRHLELNGFDPVEFDGRDPAAFAWAILEIERRLESFRGRLPYGIAVTEKGYGFEGAGTNLAHNTPLGTDVNESLVERFNRSARKLWVDPDELLRSAECFRRHRQRPFERDHPLVHRNVSLKEPPQPEYLPPGGQASPMAAVDAVFVETCRRNPHLRPRVGNPDEITSDVLHRTLEEFKHRVVRPEPGVHESAHGAIITALNEEAVCCAALANKGGINLVHTYEAFGSKMFGALRQEINFAEACRRSGRPPRWLSVPIVLTSHTYENGKNERSHQDPSLCEALLVETSPVSRVLFPPDANTAARVLAELYESQGQIWTLVVPKRKIPILFTEEEAQRQLDDGALRFRSAGSPQILLAAVGAYQLHEVLRASDRLQEREIAHSVVSILEPRRFAEPDGTGALPAPSTVCDELFPHACRRRIFVTHPRAAVLYGVLRPLDTGAETRILGFRGEGGTLDVNGMMFVNGQSWVHILDEAARLLRLPREELLSQAERDVLDRRAPPHGIVY